MRRTAILVAIPPLGMLLLLIWQVVLGHHWGKSSMSNGNVIGWTIFLWLVYLRLITIHLVTEVRNGELSIVLRGLWRSRHIPLDRIQLVEIIDHDPVREFGGYSIRTTRAGTAYLAGGRGAVRLTMSSGGKVVVGSNRAEELAAVLGNSRSG